jgi:hypothetical protein
MVAALLNPGMLANQMEFLFAGLGVMCWIIWFVIAILICIWVYKDAESRGMSGVLWLIVVLILGLIGLIVYLVVRKPKVTAPPPYPMAPPPAYAAPPPPPGYGAPAPAYGQPAPAYAPPPPPPGPAPMATNCRYCGAPVPPGSMVCPRCGGRL